MDKNCDCCVKKWEKCNCICSKCGDDYANCRYDCMVEHLGYDPNESESESESRARTIIKKWNDNIKGTIAPTFQGYLRMMYKFDDDILNETDEMKVFWCEAIDLFPNCYMKMYEVYKNSK